MASFLKFDFAKFEAEVLEKRNDKELTLATLATLAIDTHNIHKIDKFYNKLSIDEKAEFDERASIMEYDSGLSRKEAERLAMDYIINSRNLVNGEKK